MKVPQQMPHKSKAALGHADIATKPQNPCFFMNSIIHTFQSWMFFCSAVILDVDSLSSSSSSSFSFPASA